MEKVAIYCRLSEEDRNKRFETDDSNSIQNQKAMLLEYAAEKCWEVYHIYSDDNYTGSDRNRPEFVRLLRDAEARRFDIILCKSQSRFTRELELVERYINGLFPIWGYENWFYLALPVVIGVVSGLGVDVRFFRTAILDEIYKSYVRTARAKGLSGTTILVKHVLRNSLIPIVTYISLAIPYLFTGSLLLESFFGIPGLGNVSLNAIHSADMAVVRAVVVLGALLYQTVNLATDLLYAWLDPRVRLG